MHVHTSSVHILECIYTKSAVILITVWYKLHTHAIFQLARSKTDTATCINYTRGLHCMTVRNNISNSDSDRARCVQLENSCVFIIDMHIPKFMS